MSKRSRKNKEYYVVIRGFNLMVPTIFSSWGDAHPLVTGFGGSGIRGFVTLAEAETYMKAKGVEDYNYQIKPGAGTTTPEKGRSAYYAVANGRNPGIQEYYYGGAEPEVVKFQDACHKRFRTLVQAEAFIADWGEMYASIVKARVTEKLSSGHRPAKMKGLPAELGLKTKGSNDEDELIDGFDRIDIG